MGFVISEQEQPPAPKKRGRKPKNPQAAAEVKIPKKRGRKPKAIAEGAPASARAAQKPVRRAPTISKPGMKPVIEIDTAKAVAFAMSIAQEMKRSAKNEDEKRTGGEIHLSRRPTTRTQGVATARFPDADLAEFKKRLIEAREKAENGIDAMRATGFNESDDREADGGDGTNQTLRLPALGQMGNINRTIQQIEEALHRIEDGTYGVCTACGQLIRKPRLLNQPFVLTCMECQSEMERNRA